MTITRIGTVTPLDTWRRMAAKAGKEQLRAYRLNGDPRYWVVSSSSNPHVAYEVTAHDGDLLCSCRASEFLPYCKHRALVMRELGALDASDELIAA
jgi:hypothetical protein